MALKRRRLLYAITAAVIIALWWQYGRSPGSNTRPSSSTTPVIKPETVEISGPAEVPKVEIPGVEEHSTPSRHREKYPLSSFMSLPSGKPLAIPAVQFSFPGDDAQSQQERLAAVKEAFVHSWAGYKKHAWMKDELSPLTSGYRTAFSGWGATLVDSLDTILIMGLDKEFNEALNAAVTINFQKPAHVPLVAFDNNEPARIPINVFETTIRYLGGFLGAYDVSDGKYPILLEKAREVGEMLYEAFDTPNRLPVTRWSKLGVEVAAGDTLVAEIGSLSLEFTRLSQLTGDMKFFDAVQRITIHLSEQQMKTKLPGLFPITVNAREADFISNGVFTIGGMADSIYEYFPKEFVLLGGLSSQYRTLYENAITAIKEFILFKPTTPANEDILLAGTVRAFKPPKLELDPQMQHLSCFAGGMTALAAKIFDRPADLQLAERLTNGCLWAGRSTVSGIMPELFHTAPCPWASSDHCVWDADVWANDMFQRNTNDDQSAEKQLPKQQRIKLKQERLRLPQGISAIANRRYLLRPEVIESVFVMYRVTGDVRWREEAWSMFTAITNRCRTNIAFASLEDVTSNNSRQVDKMESFWLAETLKYFYLIFSEPSEISLDDYVLNTEAHPFKRPR